MFGLLKRKDRSNRTKRPCGPAGKRCYAIGDIHGRLDLLKALIADIETHNAQRAPAATSIILLGDLIDRGPDSKGVIAYVRRWSRSDIKLVTLQGNHEELLVRGLSGSPSVLESWLGVGGDACARSYGVPVGGLIGRTAEEIQAALRLAIPDADIAFLADLPHSARFGDYFFAHAGVRPGVPLDEQHPRDLHWVRDLFLNSSRDHGAVVVHGHSVSAEITERPNRIGIDTGAHKTGVLTAFWIDERDNGFLQTAP